MFKLQVSVSTVRGYPSMAWVSPWKAEATVHIYIDTSIAITCTAFVLVFKLMRQ